MIDYSWYGTSMQEALAGCQIVSETRMTEVGPGEWYFLRLGPKLLPLGIDKHFADMLAFATTRNAAAFDQGEKCWQRNQKLTDALAKIAALVDSEAGEPLDDAIKIATDAISLQPPT